MKLNPKQFIKFGILGGAILLGIIFLVKYNNGNLKPKLSAFIGYSNPPNIVVIMTDDQHNRSLNKMEKVKKLLIQQGATFYNNFASYSLCCPSRATFLTGQYAHNHGVKDNAPPEGGYAKLDHTNTLPTWLQKAGYYTAHIGKYLNGYGQDDAASVPGMPPYEIPPGWNEWYGSIDPTTYFYYNFNLNENGVVVQYQDQLGAYSECDDHPEDGKCYQTDVYAKKAVDFIQHRAQTGLNTPFFLSVAPSAIHEDCIESAFKKGICVSYPEQTTPGPEPALRHKGLFAKELLPNPPSFNESNVSDKPSDIKNLPLLSAQKINVITTGYRRRLETLMAIDETVEKIVAALEINGLLKNTVIIFTSDNGFFHGEHRIQWGKVRLYEESIGVPLVIRLPGVASSTLQNLTVNIDLAPTIVELAKASAGRIMDGHSLVPLINNPAIPWRSDFLLETFGGFSYAALRTAQFTYSEYVNGEKELYNFQMDSCHKADPFQLESQHANTCFSGIISNFQQRLQTLKTCSGANCW